MAGPRLAIYTGSGGGGVLMSDAAVQVELEVPELDERETTVNSDQVDALLALPFRLDASRVTTVENVYRATPRPFAW